MNLLILRHFLMYRLRYEYILHKCFHFCVHGGDEHGHLWLRAHAHVHAHVFLPFLIRIFLRYDDGFHLDNVHGHVRVHVHDWVYGRDYDHDHDRRDHEQIQVR